MSKQITFRLACWTEAAGKYNPDAPLMGNEDNYYLDDDLSDGIPSNSTADKVITLSRTGCIMAVADGMGGMNAGEVASQIAVETVAEYFAPEKISDTLAATHESRRRYMESVIIEADRRIKADARQDSAHAGMGSTLIMAWLVGDELSVTWIGDSRCYRFNANSGIEMLSEDHSYVQELVKRGVLKYEQTFEHPQGNIVTRSLGDESQKAKPESRCFKVYKDDVILLCSDGLSGVLRDRKTYDENDELYPGENLEDIISANLTSMTQCREALFLAAKRADWYDNVTAILCHIVDGADVAPVVKRERATTRITDQQQSNPVWVTSEEELPNDSILNQKISVRSLVWAAGAVCAVLLLVAGGRYGYRQWKRYFPSNPVVADTLTQVVTEEIPGFDIPFYQQLLREKLSDLLQQYAPCEDDTIMLLRRIDLLQDSLQYDSINADIDSLRERLSTELPVPEIILATEPGAKPQPLPEKTRRKGGKPVSGKDAKETAGNLTPIRPDTMTVTVELSKVKGSLYGFIEHNYIGYKLLSFEVDGQQNPSPYPQKGTAKCTIVRKNNN